MTIRNPYLVMAEQSQDAADTMFKQSLNLPDRPGEEMPKLLSDVTELPDDYLMEQMTEFTAWLGFASAQAAIAAVDERACQRRVDRAEDAALLDNWGGSTTDRVALSKAKAAQDPDVIAAYDALDAKHAYRKLVETLATNLDRDQSLLSRELTRRTATPRPSNRRGYST